MPLNQGITYMHEHTTIDLSGVKKDIDCKLDLLEETINEFKRLKELGVQNIVDVTNRGMGRNLQFAEKVRKASEMNIIYSTGYYKEPFLPEEVYKLSEKELCRIMVSEVIHGICDSGSKAEIIGEVGTSKNEVTPIERKVLAAAAMAQVETGKPLTTHTTLGTCGFEQIEVFKEYGVDLSKVIIGHVDLSGDINYILRLIDAGVNVAFDTVGKINYMPEETRLEMLKEICVRGLSERVVMSVDITRRSHLKTRGGIGYSYLLESFIPYIKAEGIEQKHIDRMLVHNPGRIFK